MATRRLRMEIIRFGLLLTMTVALISVAVRHGDDHGSRNQASGGHRASTSPSPSTSSGDSSDAGSSGSGADGGSGGTPSTGAAGSGTSSGGTGSSAGGGGGSTDSTVATLPRTGGTQAVELAALAALFIAAGTFTMRVSRPATTGQVGAAPIERTQSGQALGSSESNRPGTV